MRQPNRPCTAAMSSLHVVTIFLNLLYPILIILPLRSIPRSAWYQTSPPAMGCRRPFCPRTRHTFPPRIHNQTSQCPGRPLRLLLDLSCPCNRHGHTLPDSQARLLADRATGSHSASTIVV